MPEFTLIADSSTGFRTLICCCGHGVFGIPETISNQTIRMERTSINKPINVVERNIALTGEFTRYLLEHPQMLQTLPEQFEVVILPEDDPDMRQYNLELLDRYGAEGKPVVFVRMRVHTAQCRRATPIERLCADSGINSHSAYYQTMVNQPL